MLSSDFFLIGQSLKRQQRHFETTSVVYKKRQGFSYCHAAVNAIYFSLNKNSVYTECFVKGFIQCKHFHNALLCTKIKKQI